MNLKDGYKVVWDERKFTILEWRSKKTWGIGTIISSYDKEYPTIEWSNNSYKGLCSIHYLKMAPDQGLKCRKK